MKFAVGVATGRSSVDGPPERNSWQLAESLRRDASDPLKELLAWRVGRLWLQGR